MQSSNAASVKTAASNSAVPQQVSDPNSGLAWNAPGVATLSTATGNAPAEATRDRSNEPAVTVPTDGESLRFPLPAPESERVVSLASAPPGMEQPGQLAAGMSQQTVVPASYNAPAPDNHSGLDSPIQNLSTQIPATGPWRSPQIQPPSSTPNEIDVRLRAVPSPPPMPVLPTTPRIRLPGSATQQPIGNASIAGQPTAFYAIAAPPPGSSISPDGFRPRGSMR
jgi:hypothetical protein